MSDFHKIGTKMIMIKVPLKTTEGSQSHREKKNEEANPPFQGSRMRPLYYNNNGDDLQKEQIHLGAQGANTVKLIIFKCLLENVFSDAS